MALADLVSGASPASSLMAVFSWQIGQVIFLGPLFKGTDPVHAGSAYDLITSQGTC